jgi:hypothetical protein
MVKVATTADTGTVAGNGVGDECPSGAARSAGRSRGRRMHITDLEHEHTVHCWWNWADESWVCHQPDRAGSARPDLPETVLAPPDAGPRGGSADASSARSPRPDAGSQAGS